MDSAGSLTQSMPAFPLVGAAVGLAAGALYVLISTLLPHWAAALVAVGALIAVTGALHEDGLADFADGLGARGDTDRRLDAMRDSHTGVFGVLALILSVLLRAAVLSAAPSAVAALGVMVAAGALSRASFPAVMLLLPPARADGLGAGAGQPDRTIALQAAVVAAPFAAMGLGFGGAIAGFLAVAAAAALIAAVAKRAIGGYTGDVLGAAQQAGEIAVLLVAAALW